MSNILVTTDQQILRITEAPRIAAEGMNENYVVFTFDESWDGYGKTVLFFRKEDDSTRYISIVDGEGKALVPNAVTEEEGVFCFSLTGTKGNVEYTSEIVKYQVFRGMNATRSGETPTPTPDIYTQIMEAIGQLQSEIEGVAYDLDQAVRGIEGEIEDIRSGGPVKIRSNDLAVGIGTDPLVDNQFVVNPNWLAKFGEVDLSALTVGGDPVFASEKFQGTEETIAAGTAGHQNVAITTPSGYTPVMVTYLSEGNIVPGYCESWSLTTAVVYYTNLHTGSLAFTPSVYVLFAKL